MKIPLYEGIKRGGREGGWVGGAWIYYDCSTNCMVMSYCFELALLELLFLYYIYLTMQNKLSGN